MKQGEPVNTLKPFRDFSRNQSRQNVTGATRHQGSWNHPASDKNTSRGPKFRRQLVGPHFLSACQSRWKWPGSIHKISLKANLLKCQRGKQQGT